MSVAGISFVVPLLNARPHLRRVFAALSSEARAFPHEIIVVDDGSTDGSLRILRELEAAGRLRLIGGDGRGAAAAINKGIADARFPIVCQVDQDVVLEPGWTQRLVDAMADPDVAAAQGQYRTDTGAGLWARAMGRDLEQRYAAIRTSDVDHVCTGNTAYRASALRQVGLLDESLGYGYDNDLSYRLTRAGYRLVFCRAASSVHLWRDSLSGYLRQQFGVGYGRLDVLARHPRRAGGDDVSGAMMMLHAPAALTALLLIGGGLALDAGAALAGAAIVALLVVERGAAGVRAWRASGDAAALAFPCVHLLRDLAWAAAIVAWMLRRSAGRPSAPAHSMMRAPHHALLNRAAITGDFRAGTTLAILPAFNEAGNLPRVIAELRRTAPALDLLVVNDGSTDETPELLPTLGIRWLTMSQRVGVGGAVRAGIRYAVREGYEFAVRVDGDGQHRPCDIARLFAPVASGRADAAIGSRFVARRRGAGSARRLGQALLAGCLSLLTGRRITDPTSGFWLFGPRALRMLARHHPAGYSEPELVLLLHRNGLRLEEVPIRMRPRLNGRTSLTPGRAAGALARTLLALVVVPLRRTVEDARD